MSGHRVRIWRGSAAAPGPALLMPGTSHAQGQVFGGAQLSFQHRNAAEGRLKASEKQPLGVIFGVSIRMLPKVLWAPYSRSRCGPGLLLPPRGRSVHARRWCQPGLSTTQSQSSPWSHGPCQGFAQAGRSGQHGGCCGLAASRVHQAMGSQQLQHA